MSKVLAVLDDVAAEFASAAALLRVRWVLVAPFALPGCCDTFVMSPSAPPLLLAPALPFAFAGAEFSLLLLLVAVALRCPCMTAVRSDASRCCVVQLTGKLGAHNTKLNCRNQKSYRRVPQVLQQLLARCRSMRVV